MSTVVINYIKIAGYVSVEFLLAWALVLKIIVPYFPHLTTDKVKHVLFLIGTGALLVAGIGRLGFDIQTSSGNTPPEVLDNIIFWTLSLGGTFLLLLDYFITQHTK